MSIKKSQKTKKKQQRPKKRTQSEILKRRLEKCPFKAKKIVINPKGEVKMSEVLREFVDPYYEFAKSKEAYNRLFTLGVLAWNTSLLPKEKHKDMMEKILTTSFSSYDELLKMEAGDIVSELIKRKKKYYSENKRFIVDFKVKDTGSDFHITVASTLSDEYTFKEKEI